jgi:hypothetical protein
MESVSGRYKRSSGASAKYSLTSGFLNAVFCTVLPVRRVTYFSFLQQKEKYQKKVPPFGKSLRLPKG